MSKYTTGEVARRCDVTVRTVQYYDTRGILTPSELTEGGRRLYSEADVERMKIICFLRELGLPIDAIGKLLSEEDPGSVLQLLLETQEAALKEEIRQREEKLHKLSELKSGLKAVPEFSVESIGDIAYTMHNKEKLRKIHTLLVLTGIPMTILQWAGIALWIAKGDWRLFALWAILAVPYGILASRWYFRRVSYLCPKCHRVFRPAFREAFFARHTPATRRLTCPNCGHVGFCVEVALERDETGGA